MDDVLKCDDICLHVGDCVFRVCEHCERVMFMALRWFDFHHVQLRDGIAVEFLMDNGFMDTIVDMTP